MIRGTYVNFSWCSRRWYKDWFWKAERMAEHEEIRRAEAELEIGPQRAQPKSLAAIQAEVTQRQKEAMEKAEEAFWREPPSAPCL